MPAPVYRFADYRLDPATRELHRGGGLVALPPRAFDCLAYLVERRDRAVGRDELIAAVWGKAEVSDTLLAQTILRVRRAVGDTGNEQHAVRTVPRFGYRWVLPTETITATAAQTASTMAPSAPSPTAAAPSASSVPVSSATAAGAAYGSADAISRAVPSTASPAAPAATAIARSAANRHDDAPGPGSASAFESAAATPSNPTPPSAAAEAAITATPPGAIPTAAKPRRLTWLVLAAAAVLAALAWWRSTTPPPAVEDRATAGDMPAGGATGSPDSASPIASAAIVLPVEVNEGAEWSWVRLGGMDFLASQLRAAGQATLPSDTTLVLLARNPAPRHLAADLAAARATGAPLVLASQARREGTGWNVRIEAYAADGRTRRGEASAEAVLDAARLALAELAGPAVAGEAGGERAEHLQRAEAAMLADDLDLARREIDAVAAAPDDAELIYRRAQIDFRAGDYETLEQRLLGLLPRLDPARDAVLRGRVLNALGSAEIRRNRMGVAARYHAEAAELLRPGQDKRALGQAYTGLAITQAAQRQFDDALATFALARVALEQGGDALAVARVDANLGILDVERARYAEAVAGLRRAAARFAAFGAVNEQLTTLIGLARAQAEMLDIAGASQTADELWSLASRSASPRLRHQMAVVRADVLAQCGRLQEARALLAGLRPELELPQENDTQARADAVLARLALADGDAAQALRLATAGLEGLPLEQYGRERAQLWLLRLRALRALERTDEALALLPQFSAQAGQSGETAAPLYADLAAAELDWAQGRREPARQRYAGLLSQAERSGIAVDLALVVQSYAGALLESGDAQAAAPVVARVARWADADFGCALLQVWAYWAQGDLPAWQQALGKARGLAGERPIAPVLSQPPQPPRIR
ncbi:winged helix-turn-helix domain-containing protein [Tahibacter harae]|uniref:Transcriptional regulator n=1 Tax=Tahibacter harae TaxID=2963937 RepID=A0ABT1QSI1_9GAMM|nr:transcriptional regulator [Tahibacter harae]MCQ4165255.1 transcriptional regulator [Tahibacter harae]